jgi:hypothetical protein
MWPDDEKALNHRAPRITDVPFLLGRHSLGKLHIYRISMHLYLHKAEILPPKLRRFSTRIFVELAFLAV